MKCVVSLLLLLPILLVAGSSLRSNHYTQFYQSVQDDLKEDFLCFELAEAVLKASKSSKDKLSPIEESLKSPSGLGMSEEVFQKLQAMQVPEGFSDNLYEIVKEKFDLTLYEAAELASKREFCRSVGVNVQCHDIGDPGANCC
ncbi:uncharacterized protein [Periplaneta americana]|uniref:uncharacterized protein n=1 Tax=Periplaneta americana TaxID=6978 RepID=UPI0037E9C8E6